MSDYLFSCCVLYAWYDHKQTAQRRHINRNGTVAVAFRAQRNNLCVNNVRRAEFAHAATLILCVSVCECVSVLLTKVWHWKVATQRRRGDQNRNTHMCGLGLMDIQLTLHTVMHLMCVCLCSKNTIWAHIRSGGLWLNLSSHAISVPENVGRDAYTSILVYIPTGCGREVWS